MITGAEQNVYKTNSYKAPNNVPEEAIMKSGISKEKQLAHIEFNCIFLARFIITL